MVEDSFAIDWSKEQALHSIYSIVIFTNVTLNVLIPTKHTPTNITRGCVKLPENFATNIILLHITSIRDKYNNIAHTNFTTTFKVEPSYTKSTNI